MTMSQQTVFFGMHEGLFPGRVCRVGSPIDWAGVKRASYLREQRDNRTSNASLNIGANSSSHKSAPSPSKRRFTNPKLPTSQQGASNAEKPPPASKRPSSAQIQMIPTPEKLRRLLLEPVTDMAALRKLAWGGLPSSSRAEVWKILLGYVSTNQSRRNSTLERKRREYRDAVEQHYSPLGNFVSKSQSDLVPSFSRSGTQEDLTMRQITVDLPRTCPGLALFHIPEVRQALERILYVWATRHPASGYVQGMNDLVTPFVCVFMAEHIMDGNEKDALNVNDLSDFSNPKQTLANAEADSYWCLTTLLNDIQDYYTFSQPGIQRRVHSLRELVARVDSNLYTHLEEEGLDFLQFAFRWMNCLLMRELPFPLIIRVWDTYLAETDGFAIFHVYVCAALLVSFSEELLEMDFQDLVLFLQNLPTENWTHREIDVIISQAYMWKAIFESSPSHLQ